MAKAELGTKRIDPETGQKFYDLGKDPIVSPYTGTEYPRSFFEVPPRAPKRGSAGSGPVHREVEAEPETEVVEREDDEEEAEVISLTDVEEDEGATPKADNLDIDDDEEVEKADDDTFLAIDEDDEDDDVADIIGSRDDDE